MNKIFNALRHHANPAHDLEGMKFYNPRQRTRDMEERVHTHNLVTIVVPMVKSTLRGGTVGTVTGLFIGVATGHVSEAACIGSLVGSFADDLQLYLRAAPLREQAEREPPFH